MITSRNMANTRCRTVPASDRNYPKPRLRMRRFHLYSHKSSIRAGMVARDMMVVVTIQREA